MNTFILIAQLLAAPSFAGETSAISQLMAESAAIAAPARVPDAPEAALFAIDELKGDDRYWLTVSASGPAERTRLLEAGFDIVEVKEDSVSGFARKQAMQTLSAAGWEVLYSMTIYDYAKKHLKDFPAADSVYHNYAETLAALQELNARFPGLTSLFSVGKTTEGRDVWCLRINPDQKGTEPSTKPGAFFVANHHAREHLTAEVALALAAHLLENAANPEISGYIRNLDIHVIPMLNADGAEYDIKTGKYRWHRKNTRVNADKSVGVDLNRNYDTRWCRQGASQSPSADTYCGPYAFSEPETAIVRDFVLSRPNIRTLMSYHTYGKMILYPYAGKDSPLEDARDLAVFRAVAGRLGAITGYRPMQASDLYVATGDTGDWAYEARRIFAFTSELEGSGFYPGAAIIPSAAASNIKAALYLLSVTSDPYSAAR